MYIFACSFLYIIKCIFASYPLMSMTTIYLGVDTADALNVRENRKWSEWSQDICTSICLKVSVCYSHFHCQRSCLPERPFPISPFSNYKNCPSQHGQRSQGRVPGCHPSQRYGWTLWWPVWDHDPHCDPYRCKWQSSEICSE